MFLFLLIFSCKDRSLKEKILQLQEGKTLKNFQINKIYKKIKNKRVEQCVYYLVKDKKTTFIDSLDICLEISNSSLDKNLYDFFKNPNEDTLKNLFKKEIEEFSEFNTKKKIKEIIVEIDYKKKFYEKYFPHELNVFKKKIIDEAIIDDIFFLKGKINYRSLMYKKGFFKEIFLDFKEDDFSFLKEKISLFLKTMIIKRLIDEKKIYEDYFFFKKKALKISLENYSFLKNKYVISYQDIFHWLFMNKEITEKEYKKYQDKSLKDLEPYLETLTLAFFSFLHHRDEDSKDKIVKIFYFFRQEVINLNKIEIFYLQKEYAFMAEEIVDFLFPYPEYSENKILFKDFFKKFFKKILEGKT